MSHIHNKRYVLRNDGSATPVFSVENRNPLAGNEADENLLLQSGFPSEASSPGCVVSAALQLNGDCGIYDSRPPICREHSNDYCEYDAPSEDGFDLYFQNYEDLLAYCKKRFKRWGE